MKARAFQKKKIFLFKVYLKERSFLDDFKKKKIILGLLPFLFKRDFPCLLPSHVKRLNEFS